MVEFLEVRIKSCQDKIIEDVKGANKLRAYRVLIDDKYVGVIHKIKTKEFDVDFGEHTIQCTIDWERSNHITVDIQDDLEELEVIAKGVFGLPYVLSFHLTEEINT
ncbi:hypothetical protein ICE98_00012 [Lactococcus lactis]|nr:hypothetical protein [Lactococcus lactis]